MQLEDPEFWSDSDRAQKVQQRLAGLRSEVKQWSDLQAEIEDAIVLSELADEEDDEATQAELSEQLERLRRRIETQEIALMLGGEHDGGNAILDIHPGAGGTESQDWAAMLLRMYLRWAEVRGFATEVLDHQYGDQAGLKSATVLVEGPNAYGYLSAENGIHRLVRISPFDANSRRHTSFAAVYATPDLEDDVEVEIRTEDLRVDTYRSGGPGGQHANKTDSAVRMTHIPTGIVVSCQNERSQHKNRATALRVLRSRLYAHQDEQRREEQAKLEGKKREIAFGSQIRSYVFHPYQMVKDHRTGVEDSSVDGVMDGAIDAFIEGYLKQQGGLDE